MISIGHSPKVGIDHHAGAPENKLWAQEHWSGLIYPGNKIK